MHARNVFVTAVAVMAFVALAGSQQVAAQEPAPAAAGPVASTDGEQPSMRIDITEFKRSSGETLTLKFSLINASTDTFQLGDLLSSGRSVSGIYLLDAANKKKYHVIMDAAGQCVCSSMLPYTLEAGQTINMWAKFPAPPVETTEVAVVIPRFIPMDGVPIAP